MRNIDEIKLLRKDRNRYKSLAQKQFEEVERLNKEREKILEGVKQIQQASDILATTCAVMFGNENETGYVLTLPRSFGQHNLQAFRLQLRNTTSDEMIIEAIELAKLDALIKKKTPETEAADSEKSTTGVKEN
ncbi:MAG: hypothetical protein RR365_11290 [Bacteroides sp.]